MPLDIHAPMQNPCDVQRVGCHAVEHNVGADCILTILFADAAYAAGFGIACEVYHCGDKVAYIFISLLERPALESVEPDLLQVGFGARP